MDNKIQKADELLHQRILTELMSAGKRGLTTEELRRRLGLSHKSEKREFDKALKRLSQRGEIVWANGRLAACQKALLKGVLQGNKRGFAFLLQEGGDIFIPNKGLNGAMHGDTVLVSAKGGEGEVIKILSRGACRIAGTLYEYGGRYFVQPDKECFYKDIFIPHDKLGGASAGEKVAVAFLTEKADAGEVVDRLGKAGERLTEILSVLHSFGFRRSFPEQTERALAHLPPFPTGRIDLTRLLTVTIDGEDAKDFDDAISVERTSDGYKLYVHIADVAHYVLSGGAIDKEALERGMSVYFPEAVFPMLPEAISNGVCSLVPGENRAALTAEMLFTDTGALKDAVFYESVIKSDFRLTYTEVAASLGGGGKSRSGEVSAMLEAAADLAGVLTKKRRQSGAISFMSSESRFVLDEGRVVDVSAYPEQISNNIIEQFMIAANECAAAFLIKRDLPCVFRVHEPVTQEKLSVFLRFIKGLGYSMDLSAGVNPSVFADFLDKVKGDDAEYVINKVMLRSMQKARYDVANSGHFGLALAEYCHFTAPIRRYSDLVVHRVLKAALNGRADGRFIAFMNTECERAAVRVSEREVAAERAEREVDDYYKALYMESHIGERYDGVVSGVTKSGIFVMLKNTVEGFVGMGSLPPDRYEPDEANFRLLGTKYAFQMGDIAEVIIKSADASVRRVDMEIVSDASTHLRKRNRQRRDGAV